MANTYIKIGSTVTVGVGGAASISFSSIPSTYTDLIVKVSARTDYSAGTVQLLLSLNGSAASFSSRYLLGNGAAASSGTLAQYVGQTEPSTYTSSTFSSHDIFIPNYAGSTNKSYSSDSATENNATTSYADLIAGLWSNTAAITSISLGLSSGNFVQYSTASLYGIKNS
jgi:hypothetical protein